MSGFLTAIGDMFNVATVASIVAGASGLLFATMGETISEKAGVINLSVDGSMMLAALAGFVVAFQTGTVWYGFPAAAAGGIVVALVIAYGNIRLSLNQVAIGFVMFALCTELSRFLGSSYVGRVPVAVPAWDIPGLSSIPFFGQVLFSHNIIVYLSMLTVLATYVFMYRTRAGLELGRSPSRVPCVAVESALGLAAKARQRSGGGTDVQAVDHGVPLGILVLLAVQHETLLGLHRSAHPDALLRIPAVRNVVILAQLPQEQSALTVDDHAHGAVLALTEQQHHRLAEVGIQELRDRDEQPGCE